MSVAGLKKQFHKASQLLSEKISGVEGTKLDEEFLDMERTSPIKLLQKFFQKPQNIFSQIQGHRRPCLQAYRAKLGMLNTVSKIRGQVKTTGYPQTEGLLGDCLLKYGKELGEDSSFGNALLEVGESMKLMAEVKDSLDITVKQTFIDPLQLLQDKDLKEIGHHLRKLEGRRLDYDYKKKRVGKIPEDEVRQAVDKFEESKELAERSMFNFLENDDLGCVQRPQTRVQAQACEKKSERAQWAVSCLLRQDHRPRGAREPALLPRPLRLRAREPRRAGLQRRGRHRLDRPARRELVRRGGPRGVRILPH
ncbi:endophilin-A3 isoform X3 [Talpa occidentalis]|uniref:endophilin-A3 isoform X3 n=1 Tax=Talpa occidentalis TaxID=50954 RepID=UPI00188F5F7F|nr:endophilin-A3 isoform X3 [Talpa occidentalis]